MKAILKKVVILFVFTFVSVGLGIADTYGPYRIYSGENLGFQVVNGVTGEPLSGVDVEYSGGGAFESESGRFYIIGSSPGTYLCYISKSGYSTEEFCVEVVLPPARRSSNGLIVIKLYPIFS